MTSVNATSLIDYLATLDPMRTAALLIGLLVAQGALYLLLHYATRHGRARAREGALAWADVKRVEWRARAEARAVAVGERATPEARAARRAHLALMGGALAVLVVAVAAINLSAHGIQARLGEVGLDDANARVSVFLVFEGLLALAAGLSFWHQVTGRTGIDRYAIGMWIVSLVMAYLAAWGGGSALYAAFPIIAAVAGHELVVAEAKRRGKYRGILGRGVTAEDSDDVGAQRRETRIVMRIVRANTGARGTRWAWNRLYLRAHGDADARGELTEERCARITSRVAAHYAGAGALSPAAVAGLNPWARALEQGAREARTDEDAVERVPAPRAAEAPVRAQAREVERAPRLQLVTSAAPEVEDMPGLVAQYVKHSDAVREFVLNFWEAKGELPTGRQLADKFGGDPGNCRKWVSDLKKVVNAAA